MAVRLTEPTCAGPRFWMLLMPRGRVWVKVCEPIGAGRRNSDKNSSTVCNVYTVSGVVEILITHASCHHMATDASSWNENFLFTITYPFRCGKYVLKCCLLPAVRYHIVALTRSSENVAHD